VLQSITQSFKKLESGRSTPQLHCNNLIHNCKKYNYLGSKGVVIGKNDVLIGNAWCYSNCYNCYVVYTYYILNVNNMETRDEQIFIVTVIVIIYDLLK
jgi:hypothetical protein